jgi:hypothetical protein
VLADGTIVQVPECPWLGFIPDGCGSENSRGSPRPAAHPNLTTGTWSQVTADAAQDKLYCVLLTAAKGIPAGVALALLFVWMVVMYFQKTKNGEQLSAQEMKRLMDIQADINGNIAKKHKDLKKRLTEDALDDHLA